MDPGHFYQKNSRTFTGSKNLKRTKTKNFFFFQETRKFFQELKNWIKNTNKQTLKNIYRNLRKPAFKNKQTNKPTSHTGFKKEKTVELLQDPRKSFFKNVFRKA